MANCKVCGQPVAAAPVFHPDCWDEKVNKAVEEFCDHFCKFPGNSKQDDWEAWMTENICAKYCPFITLMDLIAKEGTAE